jgi:hypothetical protein
MFASVDSVMLTPAQQDSKGKLKGTGGGAASYRSEDDTAVEVLFVVGMIGFDIVGVGPVERE